MTPDAPVRKEVSCLALTFFYDYLESQGVERGRIQLGLPYPPEHLDDRFRWIDFATFLEIERRVRDVFPEEPDLYFQIGRTLSKTQGFGFLRTAARVLVSPLQVYDRLPNFVNRFLFPFVTITFEERGPMSLRGRYAFQAPYVPSDAYLDTVRGILTAIPEMVGAPPADVALRRESELVAIFDIEILAWRGLVERMRSWISGLRRGLAAGDEAARELESTNTLLAEKVEALTDAKAQLDRRVRDLTLLNTLARTAASELDLPRLLAGSADLIHRELRGPVLLFVAEGSPPALVLAEARGASSDDLAPILGLADEAVSGPTLPTWLTELGWRAAPMTGHDRLVGAVFVRMDVREQVGGLVGALASQLAIAVQNALAFRTIAELRDHLDLRVRERTAELEEARTQLQDTVARLVQADAAKANFFTNVSHELRTPLTLILGPVQDLEATLDDPAVREELRVIGRNAENLLNLVNEILDFARLDAGAMPMESEDLDIAALVDDVVVTLAPLATRKGLQVGWALPEGPVAVKGDPRLLRRVFVNLLGNAVKYCRHGDRVNVRVGVDGEDAFVEVADSGPGVPEADQEHIFTRFRRASVHADGATEGTGIGLSMASDITRLHGGHIELESAPGRGATFRVRLPTDGAVAPAVAAERHSPLPVPQVEAVDMPAEPPVRAEVVPEEDPALLPASRVLLVEDNPDMRAFMARLLSRHHRVTAVRDGEEALIAAAAEAPDAIVADVMMPRMGGVELCRRLRADPATRTIPVLLVSARHGPDAALEGLEAGADDYVTKPFSGPELLARISAQVRIRSLNRALLRMEKQSSLGVLAAGVAHELLNPVNAVVNAVPPLRRMVDRGEAGQPPDAARMRALLEAIELSGNRMNRVIRGILTYTRQEQRPQLTVGRVRDQVDTVVTILRYRLDKGVTVHVDYVFDDPLPHYPEWLGQVLMNLFVNAMDAMEGQGNLWVRVERDSDRVRVRVTDDGPGVPAAVRERIFDPFFTTKAPGSGTGLGLAISREIAALHGGSLELDESMASGAAFVLTLPLMERVPTSLPLHGPPAPRAVPGEH